LAAAFRTGSDIRSNNTSTILWLDDAAPRFRHIWQKIVLPFARLNTISHM